MENVLKKALAGVAVGAMLASAPSVYGAAAGSTTVSVNLPTVLIMYHFDTIDIEVADSAVASFLAAGATNCSDLATPGSEFCLSQGALDLTGSPVTDLAAATVDAGLSDTNPALPGSLSADFTVQNAVGVRAIGCTTYDAAVADGGSDASVTVSAGALTGVDGAGCSTTMTTGDLEFSIDFATAGSGTVDAVFDITVAGI